jgi:hypothetical protein
MMKTMRSFSLSLLILVSMKLRLISYISKRSGLTRRLFFHYFLRSFYHLNIIFFLFRFFNLLTMETIILDQYLI